MIGIRASSPLSAAVPFMVLLLIAFCPAVLRGDDDLASREEAALKAAVERIAPCVVRIETLKKFPGLRESLRRLGGRITEEKMRELNYLVDGEHRDVKEVVSHFLEEK